MSENEPDLIDETYQIRSIIARGNRTQICEVLEKGTGRTLAMKLVIEGKPEETKAAKAELKAEAAIATQLVHPNIIRYENFSSSRDATYLLMEFYRAANVKSQIKSELPSLHSRARPLMEGVCQALAYVHDLGWLHLDIKPDNVLLNRAGEPKLIDFSLAMKFAQGFGKMLGMGTRKVIQGTRTYIAPEVIQRKSLSPQTDIYSLGVTFFEILTGKTPFQGATPADLLNKHLKLAAPLATNLNPNLTPEVDELLARMLAKKPGDRPGSMQEVYQEIHKIKLFQQDAMELEAAKQEQEHAEKMSVMAMLDSRTDAQRSELLKADPSLAQQFEADRQARQARRKSKPRIPDKKLDSPSAPKPAVPAMSQQPAMMQPGMMPPGGMMMPQPMMPPMMMPQPMMSPMMPQPMMPPYMPAGMPGYPSYPGAPPAPAPPQMPAAPAPQQYQPPPAPAPVAPPPARPQPAAPPAPPPTPPAADPNSMEYMTELPNVI